MVTEAMTQTPEFLSQPGPRCRTCGQELAPGCDGSGIVEYVEGVDALGYPWLARHGCKNLIAAKQVKRFDWLSGIFPQPTLYGDVMLDEPITGKHAWQEPHRVRLIVALSERRGAVIRSNANLVGKSRMAMSASNFSRRHGQPGIFLNVPQMLAAIRATFEHDSPEDFTESELICALSEIPLLVLDDLGKERGTPFAEEVLFRVVNSRYQNAMPVIVTTNLRGAELMQTDRSHAIVRRLTDGAEVIQFEPAPP